MDHVKIECTRADGKPCCEVSCQFCGGDLFACSVCGGFEGSLLPACPGVRLTEQEHDANYGAYCNKTGVFAAEQKCQEVVMALGEKLIRCGKPATNLVHWNNRTEGPYWLCPEDADHYVRNRQAIDITSRVR